MSWLFGRRKHQKDSPPDSTDEEPQSDQAEGFIFVDKGPAPPPPNPAGGAPYPTSGIYPSLGGMNAYPQTSSDDSAVHGDANHYLTGVPFKLCRQLERNMNDDMEIDSLRIDEIRSFLERIEKQNYEYGFDLEQSIIAEMNSRNPDE